MRIVLKFILIFLNLVRPESNFLRLVYEHLTINNTSKKGVRKKALTFLARKSSVLSELLLWEKTSFFNTFNSPKLILLNSAGLIGFVYRMCPTPLFLQYFSTADAIDLMFKPIKKP